MRVFLRVLLFALYVALLFSLPLSVLWDGWGLGLGLLLAILFLFGLRYKGTQRIASRLQVRPLTVAEAPHLHAIVDEYARRVGITAPSIGLIQSPALNLAVFGFSRTTSVIAITQGAFERLSRVELSALMSRAVCTLWYRDVFCESWLSQFLTFLDLLTADRAAAATRSYLRRFYPFQLFLRQVILFPLALFPAYILRRAHGHEELDLQAAKLSRHPWEFAEALRLFEAMRERLKIFVPFSTRHLFLVPPSTYDPMVRVFFDMKTSDTRVRALESLSTLKVPT
jgi:Zn-dependent protease with chaperone function